MFHPVDDGQNSFGNYKKIIERAVDEELHDVICYNGCLGASLNQGLNRSEGLYSKRI